MTMFLNKGRSHKKNFDYSSNGLILFLIFLFSTTPGIAQDPNANILEQPGIIGTIVLGAMILIIATLIAIIRARTFIKKIRENNALSNLEGLKQQVINLDPDRIAYILGARNSKALGEHQGESDLCPNPYR